MLGKSARQRHWVLLALTTLTAAVLCGGGLSYEASRSRALHEWVRERLPPTSQAAALLLEALRMRAELAAAGVRLDSAKLAFAGALPEAELRLLERDGDSYRTVSSPLLNANPVDDIMSLPQDVLSGRIDQSPFLWPAASPQSIVFCSQARAGRVACASLPLNSFLTLSAGPSALGIRYSLSLEGRDIARTPKWQDGDPAYEEQQSFLLGDVQLQMKGRASRHLKESYGMTDGRYFAFGTVAVYLVALAALLAHRRGIIRQLALEDAIQHTRYVGEDLIRATLRNAAKSAGILVWLVHEDERLELIGPWSELAGVPEGETTLSNAVASFRDRESIRSSLLEAVRTRKSWSRVLLQDIDGETNTYQANCSPLFDADGRFVTMLGVSSDITEALHAQSQVMHDEAYRNAQADYLRHMAREVSGPAMHVQAVVDLLPWEFGVDENPELKRLLNLAAAEARRLSEVVRGSLELMNLRSNDAFAELRAMQVDELVREAVEGVAAREGTPREQLVVVEGTSNGYAMVHKQSLVSMLNIVLTNAMRYSPIGGLIEVRLKPEERALHIQVEDSGPGMKPKELARLGEPFFRGVSSIRIQGSGLGIATCLELAKRTRSSVSFAGSSNPERGLLVTITLPWSK